MRLHHIPAAMIATIIATIAFLGACTSPRATSPTPTSGTDTPKATNSPSPSRSTLTVDPTLAAAEAAILEAYHGFWDATVASFADPTKDQDPKLVRYADDTALTDTQSTLLSLRANGIKLVGKPTLSPVVSDIQVGNGPTATITDCVDSTQWQPVFTATGKSAAAAGQLARVVTVSTAFKPEASWLIRKTVIHRDQPC